MDNESDYKQQWHNFLTRGGYYFSEELLTPDLALLVSPDGSKIKVIGDITGAKCDYDDQAQVVEVSYCKGSFGNSFTCPVCGQLYMMTLKAREQDDDIVFIQQGRDFYDCACGVEFLLEDRYETVSLPFDIEELAPLYFAGLSQTADLLVRYILSSDGQSLVEEVCEVTQHMPEEVRLTDKPDFKFEAWTTPPCFITGGFRVHNVRIWRRRVYKLGSDTFEESTYKVSGDYWDTVTRKVGYIGDWYTNSRMLEALDVAFPDAQGDSTPLGGRPVKFEPTEQQIKDFAPEYKKAKDSLDDKLKNRNLRQFGRYDDNGRFYILKQAYPDAPEDLLKKMKHQRKASRAALHYAFWKIKGPIGAWESTQLNQLLKDSRKRQPRDFSD